MKRFKSALFILLTVCLAIVMIAGCSPTDENGDDNGADVIDAIEVVLGYTGPLSGPAGEYGQDGLNGILMAVDDINAAGGIEIDGQPYKFRVAFYDDHADPTQTMQLVERLIDRDGAKVIYNMVYTSTQPMLEVNREAGDEFLIMAYTSVPLVEYAHANELAVWMPPPFLGYVEAMTQKARMEQGWTTCATVVDSGAYGQGWMDTFATYWEAYGGTVTARESGSYYADQDFSTQITAALATDPDFLLIGGPSGGTLLVVEQARDLGFEGGFVILDQAKIDWLETKLGGIDLLEGAIAVVTTANSPYPAMPEFDRRYTELYVNKGEATLTTWEAAIHYTATHGLVKAMKAAGTVDDIFAIRAAFDGIFPLLGTEYPYEFHGITDGGRMKGLGSVTMVQDGAYTQAASIFWWPQTEEEFEEAKSVGTFNPDVTPLWLKYPPQ